MTSASTSGVLRVTLFARQPARAHQRVQHAGRRALAVADQHVVECRGILEERGRLERAREADAARPDAPAASSRPGRRTRCVRSMPAARG